MQVRPARGRPVPGRWWRPWLTTATCGPRSPTPRRAGGCSPASPARRSRRPRMASRTPPPTRAQIRAWWARNPDRNVAIACGYPGPDVLDVDRKPDGASGFPALRKLRQAGLIAEPAGADPHPERRRAPVFRADARSWQRVGPAAHHRPPRRGRLCGRPALRGPPGCGRPRGRTSWCATRRARTGSTGPRSASTWTRSASGSGNRRRICATAASRTWTTWWPTWPGQPDGNRNRFLHWAANRVLDHGQDERLADLANAAVAAGRDPRRSTGRSSPRSSSRARTRTPPRSHAGQARLAPRREPEPAQPSPGAQARGRQQEPQRGRVAVLEVDRDGPELADTGRAPHGPAPRASQDRTEHHRGPCAQPEREPEHHAGRSTRASEPSRKEAAPPFCAGGGPSPSERRVSDRGHPRR